MFQSATIIERETRLAAIASAAKNDARMGAVWRDMTRCTGGVPNRRRSRAMRCRRPGCPSCDAEKNARTANRMASIVFNSVESKSWNGAVAVQFAAGARPIGQMAEAVDAALSTWSRFVQTKSFKYHVQAWGRAVSVVPAVDANDVRVHIGAVVGLRRSGLGPNGKSWLAPFMARNGFHIGAVQVAVPTDPLIGDASSIDFPIFAVSGVNLATLRSQPEEQFSVMSALLLAFYEHVSDRRLISFRDPFAKEARA